MIAPGELVMATPEVLHDAPILCIVYMPETSWDDAPQPRQGGYTGWSFMHTCDSDIEMDLHFFNQVHRIDAHVAEVIERATPGLYWRESEFASFVRDDS